VTGPKTNEGATTAGERTGTRAVVRYVRVSASKAREVLDLIRGLDVRAADDVLRFSERDVAIVVRKCLASAVANAQNNDGQDPEELYVSACFADEGPTLKRFRPRARGRATRIRKRTCHITILVSRMPEARLEQQRAKEAARPQPGRRAGRGAAAAAAARRERVARSRQAAAAAKGGPATEEITDEAIDEVVDDTEVLDAAGETGELEASDEVAAEDESAEEAVEPLAEAEEAEADEAGDAEDASGGDDETDGKKDA
jgi:large subunit ribosomal protein L22